VNIISTIFLALLLFLIVGCEDKTKEKDTTLIESNLSKIDTFNLSDIENKIQRVTITNKKVIFHNPSQGILLINIFASWCKPCMDNIEYMNILQQKYSKDIFIAGVSVNDDINRTQIKSLIEKHKIEYFLSSTPSNERFTTLLANTLNLPQNYDIPLLAMFVEGRYFAHYEGRVPIEMIEDDIKEAIKELE